MNALLLLGSLLSSPPALAAEAVSRDGSFVVTVPEGWRQLEGGLQPRSDLYEIELVGAEVVAPSDYKFRLEDIARRTEAGATAASWAGQVGDGRAGACLDTRGAVGLRVKIQTFCLVDLGGDRAALLRMSTSNLVRGTEFSDELQSLLPLVRGTGVVPATPPVAQALPPAAASYGAPGVTGAPAGTASGYPTAAGGAGDPSRSTSGGGGLPASSAASVASGPGAGVASGGPSLAALGYVCTEGRWNASMPGDDLQVWWKADTKELIAHFSVQDGGETVAFTLGGVVEVGPTDSAGKAHQELFGHLQLREGPSSSVSGIHRFFQSMDVQGTVDNGVVSAFRGTRDENFTRLGGCSSS